MRGSRWARAGRVLGVVLIYAAVTVWVTWPLAPHAGAHLFAPQQGWITTLYQGDLLLIIWIQRWVMHALATNPLHLLDANTFHPVPGVLVRSEFLFGSLVIFAPLYWLTGNPVLAQNGCALASFVLSGGFMHWLLRRWTASTAAAFVGGLAFAFATWRSPEGLGRAHLLQTQYLPLVLLGLEHAARTGWLRPALITAAVIVLQAMCSSYAGYHVFLLAGAYGAADLITRSGERRRRAFRGLAVAVLPALAVAVTVALPYLRAKSSGEMPDANLPLRLHPDVIGDWIGVGTTLLAIGALPFLIFARRDRPRTIRLVTLLLTAGGAWVLARGASPIGGVLEVYSFLKSVVPGMAHIRAPERFGILASFGASALAAFAIAGGLSALRTVGWGRWARPAVIAAAVAAVLYPITRNPRAVPLAVPTGDQVPRVYSWLADHGKGGPLLELPVNTPPSAVLTAGFVQYFSTYHWLPILNGHTGYVPPQYPLIANLASQLPSAPALQMLVDCTGVRWILDHAASLEKSTAWSNLPVRGQIVGRSPLGQDWLFEIRLPPRRPCADYFLRPGVTFEGNPVAVPAKLEGSVRVDGLDLEGGQFHENQLLLTIHNQGHALWPCTTVDRLHQVSFVLGIFDRDDELVGGQEVMIPHDLGPDETIQLPLWIRFPRKLGSYVVRLLPLIGGRETPAAHPDLSWERTITVSVPGARPPPPPSSGADEIDGFPEPDPG